MLGIDMCYWLMERMLIDMKTALKMQTIRQNRIDSKNVWNECWALVVFNFKWNLNFVNFALFTHLLKNVSQQWSFSGHFGLSTKNMAFPRVKKLREINQLKENI